MLRLLGAVFMMAGSAGIGLAACARHRRRLAELQYLHSLLIIMKRDIEHFQPTLPQLFYKIGAQAREPYNIFFLALKDRMNRELGLRLKDIWKEELDKIAGETALLKDDIELIRGFTQHLGAQDLAAQVGGMEMLADSLHNTIESLSDEIDKKCKVQMCLGSLGGIFLILLLW